MKKRGDKKKTQFKHAKRRFLERHGFYLNSFVEREMIKQIQSEKAKFIEMTSNRKTTWEVEYEGEVFRIVYDKQRKSIVTCLPLDSEALNNM